MMQMTLDDVTTRTVRDRILAVLQDGRWHSGLEFVNGDHSFFCLSYSQRVGQLIRAGHHIERDRNHGGVGRYRYLEG